MMYCVTKLSKFKDYFFVEGNLVQLFQECFQIVPSVLAICYYLRCVFP